MSSDGLRYLRSVIDSGRTADLHLTSEVDYLDGTIANELLVYQYIISFVSEYHTMPSAHAVFRGTRVRLPEVADPPEYYLRQLIHRKMYNEAKDVSREINQSLLDKDLDGLDHFGNSFKTIANDPRLHNRGLLTTGQVTGTIEGLREYAKLEHSVVPLGLPTIDNAMLGGVRKADFAFLVARTNMGKTTMLLRMVKAALEGNNSVLIISMEITEYDISALLTCHLCGINPKFVDPFMLGSYDMRRFQQGIRNINENFNIFVHKGGDDMTPDKVQSLIEIHDPDIVYIDSMYLMQPAGKYSPSMDRFSKIARVTDQVLNVVIEANTPIVCSSQFNRQASKGGKEGSLENIGFSDTISTHASLIVSVKEAIESGSEDVVIPDQRTIEVLKSRKGQIPPFNIHYKFSPMYFGEVGDQRLEEASEDNEDIIEALSQTY